MKSGARLSGKKIEELSRAISDRDKEILRSLQKCRYLTTKQVTRLHFNNSSTKTAATRASNRSLSKLKDYGLIGALERRVGGPAHGSDPYIWSLTAAGFRLINLDNLDHSSRKRYLEPSSYFLTHTLTIAEGYLQLRDICQKSGAELADVQFEPECWRWHKSSKGKPVALKPDLFAAVRFAGYEDRYFIEVDRGTVTLQMIIRKCHSYLHYLKTGVEQKKHGIFPYVLWIVPSKKRYESVRVTLQEHFPKLQQLFIVITPDELERLITGGVEAYRKGDANL